MNPERHPPAIRRLLEAGGPKLVREMIRLFLVNTPKRLDSALTGLRNGDWMAVERAGHSLKSSAGYLGLTVLVERAARLEELGGQARGADAGPLVQQLSADFTAVRSLLDQVLESL